MASNFDVVEAEVSIPGYTLSLNPTDAWVAVGDDLTIVGELRDFAGDPVTSANIGVDDPMKGASTVVNTNEEGEFTYVTAADRVGTYVLSFVYGSETNNTVLVDVGNNATISLFPQLRIRNDDDVPLLLEITYEGPLTQEQAEQGIVIKDNFGTDLQVQEVGFELVVVEVQKPSFMTVDSTPQQGKEDPDIVSIGAEVCPVMYGAGQMCVDSSGTFSATAGVGLQGGIYAGKDGFGITGGVGGNLPYIVEGSAAIAIGSDGVKLVGSAGPGVAHGTITIDLIGVGKKGAKWVFESPVEPYLTDPEGRSIGVDPDSRMLVNMIPGATYTGPSVGEQIIWIPSDSLVDGDYGLDLLGIANGDYHVHAEVREGQLVGEHVEKVILSSAEFSGTIREGRTLTGVVWYDASSGSLDVVTLPSDKEEGGCLHGCGLSWA
jgi:hypothetical protein